MYFDGKIDTLKVNTLKHNDRHIANNKYSLILKDDKISFTSTHNRFEYVFNSAPLSTPKIFTQNDSMIIGIRHEAENLIYLFIEIIL